MNTMCSFTFVQPQWGWCLKTPVPVPVPVSDFISDLDNLRAARKLHKGVLAPLRTCVEVIEVYDLDVAAPKCGKVRLALLAPQPIGIAGGTCGRKEGFLFFLGRGKAVLPPPI